MPKRVKPQLVPISSLEPGQSGWLPADPRLPEVPRRKLTLKYATECRARVYTESSERVDAESGKRWTVRAEEDIALSTQVELE